MSKSTVMLAFLVLVLSVGGIATSFYWAGKNSAMGPATGGVTLDEILITTAEAEPIGNNIWRTDDNERGVSCYRSAQTGGTLSCVKVN